MLISLIIPVYNVVDYIEHCLASCIAQNLSSVDYEIVIVNDGTKDDSMSIVEMYRMQYPRLIHCISQPNGGLSSARNLGLSIAQGEYVWFIDSDDYIERNCLPQICATLQKNPLLDMLQIQYRKVFDNPFLNTEETRIHIDGVISGNEMIKKGGLPNPVPFTIYRRSFLENSKLCFVRGILHEDTEFKPRATYLAKSIASYDKICYNYYQRKEGSITSKFKLQNAEDYIAVLNSLYKFSIDMPFEDQRYFNYFIGLNMNSLLFGIQSLTNEEKDNILKILSKQHHLFYRMCCSSKIKYALEGLFFLGGVKLGLTFYNMLKK